MRTDRELGQIVVALILGFSIGAPNSLLMANMAVLAFGSATWYFFPQAPVDRRAWWLVRVIVPAGLLIYIVRSYLVL